MLYHLHRTTGPFDPNRTTYASLDDFIANNPRIAGANNPIDLYNHTCREWPDAVFMPATVRIGSGSPVLLGVMMNITAHGAAKPHEIPFIAWVRLEAESPMDQKVIRKGNPFERTFWRTPVRHAPSDSGALFVKSELRASDLETPSPGDATIWEDRARGEFVVHMDVGGGEISISMPSDRVADVRAERPRSPIPAIMRADDLACNRTLRMTYADLQSVLERDPDARNWYANGPDCDDRPSVLASYHPLIHKRQWREIYDTAKTLAIDLRRWIWLTVGEDRWARIFIGQDPSDPDTGRFYNDQWITAFSPTGEEKFVGCS